MVALVSVPVWRGVVSLSFFGLDRVVFRFGYLLGRVIWGVGCAGIWGVGWEDGWDEGGVGMVLGGRDPSGVGGESWIGENGRWVGG